MMLRPPSRDADGGPACSDGRTSRSNGRRARRVVALGMVIGLGLLGAGAEGAVAAANPTPSAVGWWWRAQSKSLPEKLPPPPTAGPGTIYVAGSPAAAYAYAAVRYVLAGDQIDPVLTLRVTPNGDQGGASAVLLACTTGSAWSSEENGQWEDAPTVDLAHCVDGVRSADGTHWRFTLGKLQLNNRVDVAIVPGGLPGGQAGSTFQLTFDAPAAGDLTVSPGVPSSVAPPPSIGGPATTAVAPVPTDGPAPALFTPPVMAKGTPSLPTDKEGLTPTAPAAQEAAPSFAPASTPPEAPAAQRWVGILILLGCGGAAAYGFRQPEDTGGPVGLGRFRAERTGPPPSLT